MHITDNLEEFPDFFFHVEGDKLGASLRENTVDEDFHEFQGTRGSAKISRVANAVAINSNTG